MNVDLLAALAAGERPDALLDRFVSSLVDRGAEGAVVHVLAHGLLLPRARAGETHEHDRGVAPGEDAAGLAFARGEVSTVGSAVAHPLASGDATLTIVGGEPPTDSDIAVAAALVLAANAAERRRGRSRRLAATFRKVARVGAGGDVRPALQSLLEDVADFVGVERLVVLERVPDGWAPAAGVGVSIDLLRADVLPPDAIAGDDTTVVLPGEPPGAIGDLVGGAPFASAPAWLHGQLVGAVVAGWDAPSIPDDDLVLLGALADVVGLGLGGGRSTVDLDHDLQQTREDFLSVLSHELRTPLAVIKGAVETLQAHGSSLDPEMARQLVERIRHRVDQEVELVDTLLSLSRLDRGQLRLFREPFDLADVVRTVVAQQEEATGRRVVLDVPEDAPTFADRDAVRQVVSHLVRNAISFSSGPVTVTADRVRDGWRVTVDDDGEGIPPALRERIFERFVSANPTAHRAGGVGVGLAVVRGLVELHGGAVGVGSSPLGGARFWFRLPDTAAD